jgi:hypothetical protein
VVVVLHACNLSYLPGELRRIATQGQRRALRSVPRTAKKNQPNKKTTARTSQTAGVAPLSVLTLGFREGGSS